MTGDVLLFFGGHFPIEYKAFARFSSDINLTIESADRPVNIGHPDPFGFFLHRCPGHFQMSWWKHPGYGEMKWCIVLCNGQYYPGADQYLVHIIMELLSGRFLFLSCASRFHLFRYLCLVFSNLIQGLLLKTTNQKRSSSFEICFDLNHHSQWQLSLTTTANGVSLQASESLVIWWMTPNF